MARQIKPGEAPEVKAKEYNSPDVDWSFFEKEGDKQIKAANNNFKFYAGALLSTQSARAYEDFKEDPVNLSVALSKLPDMISDLPEEIQEAANKKLYLNGISLVQRASQNQKNLENKQMKENAKKIARDTNLAIANDVFNMLSDTTKAKEDQSPVNKDIYLNNRITLDSLANTEDEEGRPLFSEWQKESLKMPKEAAVYGFQQFVAPMSLSELSDWKKNVFDDKDSFQKEFQIDDPVYESMRKSIERAMKQKEHDEMVEQNRQRIANHLAFMDNPIVYYANVSRLPGGVSPEHDEKYGLSAKLEEKANKIYSLADKVRNGKVDPLTMQMVVMKVASITVDDENPEIVDSNISKAYDGLIALQEAGADTEELKVYQQSVQKAMTDTTFKQGIAALAGKPNFKTLFSNKMGSGKLKGIGGLFSSQLSESNEYVNKIGKEAYVGAMAYLIQDSSEQGRAKAMAFYDQKVAEAYDYLKPEIDSQYIKRELAEKGSAMIQLNGKMVKVTGRLPNGEYIVESTGEKING